MNIVDPAEIPRAIGYLSIGGIIVKALDVFIKWRAGQRMSALEELDTSIQLAAKIRAELRAELENTRRELAAAEERVKVAEAELRTMKRQLSTEQRQMRHLEDEKP